MRLAADRLLASLSRTFQLRFPLRSGKWRAASLADRVVSSQVVDVVNLQGGIRMKLDGSDFIERHILLNGSYEPYCGAVLRKFLRPGGVFFDVGANVGYLSLLAATLVGTRGQVYSFEPNPAVAAKLRDNIALNPSGKIQVFEVALSDAPGRMPLFIGDRRNAGAGSLRRSPGSSVDVGVMRLDDLVKRDALRYPDLIKMDIEGAEVKALRGMNDLLQRKPPIICEISEWSLQQMGDRKEDLFALLDGYEASLISPARVSNQATSGVFLQYDVLFSAGTDDRSKLRP